MSIHNYNQKGFTLVEMIVSIGLFTVVAFVATGALLKTVDENRKSQSLKTTTTNINFALESMSREMRVGTNFYCVDNTNDVNTPLLASSFSNCPTFTTSDWTVAFYPSNTSSGPPCNTKPLIYAYRFKNGTIWKAETKACGDDVKDVDFNPILSEDIILTKAQVRVITGDKIKSYLQIHIKGYSDGKKIKLKESNRSYFDIQTTISQRVSD